MEIQKSTRHSKITGNFAENLILYWLSKYGFECANVDHTGIDIIARNPISSEVMGISVKSRSRNEGKEGEYIGISNDHFDKVNRACRAFNCKPYFAIVVDERDKIQCFILSENALLSMFPKGERVVAWKMSEDHIQKYLKNPDIIQFEFEYKTIKWWGKNISHQ